MDVMIENLGRNIKALRIRNNLSQQDLAEALEISIGSISKIERGVTYPSFSNLERIARILHTNAAELFSDDEQAIQSLGEVSISQNMSNQVDVLSRIRAIENFQDEEEVQRILQNLLKQIFEIAERENKKTIYEELNKDFFTLLNQLNIEQVYKEIQKIREEREHEKQRVYKREDKR
ncbi:helix-turn-helix domain-containing protein [Lactococcus garvieae]|uniref:helix-turn-helix domain-containing protein n=1 Tax=Lactococcus garvieae TaxID=1363 RepID=UPI00325227DB